MIVMEFCDGNGYLSGDLQLQRLPVEYSDAPVRLPRPEFYQPRSCPGCPACRARRIRAAKEAAL